MAETVTGGKKKSADEFHIADYGYIDTYVLVHGNAK